MLVLLTLGALAPAVQAQDDLEPQTITFSYDQADNLTSRSEGVDDVVTVEPLPPDASGRNRPASIGGLPLAWDGNGNLVQKGDLHFGYDFRNRLTEVRTSAGDLLASYAYDYRNRRVRQDLGTMVLETRWMDWQPTETYVDGVLSARRTYGNSLDELVTLERDLDLNGDFETVLHPIYDQTGNLALVSGQDGKPIERYSYDPYGQQRIFVDAIRPTIEQVLVADSMVLVEVSEGILPDPVLQGIQSGAIELRDVATDTALPLTPLDPVEHLHREQLGFSLETAPAAGSEMLLSFAPETLTDFFLNRPTAPIEISFAWPATNGPVYDTHAPEVVEVAYSDSALRVTFSELVDPDTAAPTIRVASMVTQWAVSASDPYQLVSAAPVPPGTHPLVITTDLTDLSGAALAKPFTLTLAVPPEPSLQIAYRKPDPRRVPTSAVGNLIGYHGLDRDPVTGFIYMRNRYYDPAMGRFITPDPLGYVDGPSQYAFARNSPVVFGDPLGLESADISRRQRDLSAIGIESLDAHRASAAFGRTVGRGVILGSGARLQALSQLPVDLLKQNPIALTARLGLAGRDTLRDLLECASNPGYCVEMEVSRASNYASNTSLERKAFDAGSFGTDFVLAAVTGRAATVAEEAAGAARLFRRVEPFEDVGSRIVPGEVTYRTPASRHLAQRVSQNTLAKELNTVVEPGVDMAADVAAINAGRGLRSGETFLINGRTYGTHDGVLFPISGPGFHQLSRPSFKALGVFNKFGNSSAATEILNNMGISTQERAAALKVWEQLQ
ncbi:MAG: hypothetical protein KDD11_20070 [Acidobacteria bacterium]|nr:hypothetical protein [Acidobacteriota bacterium]